VLWGGANDILAQVGTADLCTGTVFGNELATEFGGIVQTLLDNKVTDFMIPDVPN
jgi:hypothetical protein